MTDEKGSVLDRLKSKGRESRLKDKSLTLPVPGWSGMLYVRFRPVDWEALTELLEKGAEASSPADALESNLNALDMAADALLVQDDGATEPKSLADVLRDQEEEVHGEVVFDHLAVDVLDLELKNPVTGDMRTPEGRNETVLAAFGGATSPELAVADMAAKLGAWMRGADVEVLEGLAGE